jgi:hypothetical protein
MPVGLMSVGLLPVGLMIVGQMSVGLVNYGLMPDGLIILGKMPFGQTVFEQKTLSPTGALEELQAMSSSQPQQAVTTMTLRSWY